MGRRSDHSRDELYTMALAAARKIAEKEGLRGLTARRIAREIGYTVGTLYNLFDNLDGLIVHLNGTTLDTLYEAVTGQRFDDEPEAELPLQVLGHGLGAGFAEPEPTPPGIEPVHVVGPGDTGRGADHDHMLR